MNRHFNVTGPCDPDRHYMVDLSAKNDGIVDKLISRQAYFTVERPQRYGKTAILRTLEEHISSGYVAVRIGFMGSDSWFESFGVFADSFCS